MAHIVQLNRFPFKGAGGESLDALDVDPKIGIIGDRRFAVKKLPKAPDGQWLPKGALFVGMNTPGIVAELPVYDDTGKPDPVYLAGLGERLGCTEPVPLIDTGGTFNLTDTKGACVSFLNLASVRAFEAYMTCPVDPRRFRMNVWFEGLRAFEELTWVNGFPGTREIVVGGIRFRVDDACERCKAPEANPETGAYDIPVMKGLHDFMTEREYRSPHRRTPCVMGILAVPLSPGTLHIRGNVELLESS